MRANLWREVNFVLFLHVVAILSTAYDKRSIFSINQLSIKNYKWEKLF